MEKEMNSTIRGWVELLASADDLARTGACKSLIAIGGPAVPFLIGALKNSDYLVRWEAAKALSAIGDPTSAEALVQALEDEEFEVRWRAAEGLTKMGPDGLRALFQALSKDADSVSLREMSHHILHDVSKGDLRDCVLPVLTALEGMWSSVELPAAALRALEKLEVFEETHLKTHAIHFKGASAKPWIDLADLGTRSRARRYAKTFQHRTI